MSKRLTDREKLLVIIDRLPDHDLEVLLELATRMEKHPALTGEEPSEEDLLNSLSTEWENRRARQVYEWESARRRAEAVALWHH